MEGLVPAATTATASAFQLILDHLGAVLLLIFDGVRHVPALPAILWVTLVGTLLVVSLMAEMTHVEKCDGAGQSPSARDEVRAGRGESTGPVTEADEAPEPPEFLASPLSLQTFCLKALNEHLSRMLSLQDLVDLVKTVSKSRPPQRAHMTDEKPVSKALGTDGEQLQKNAADDLSKDTRHPQSPELCQGEIMGCEQDAQEKEEEKQRLGQAKARAERVLRGRVSQSVSVAGNPLQTSPRPEVLGGQLAHVRSQVEPQEEAENGDQFVHGSEGDLKGSLQCADEENQGRVGRLWEQTQINEALAADLTRLRTEKASLQHENLNLKAEVQQLKLKLQLMPDSSEDRVTELQRQLFEAERRCLEMEKKLLSDWGYVNSTYQMLGTYRKMVQNMNQELRRSTFYYKEGIQYHRERAEEAWMAAKDAERRLQELCRGHDHDGKMPAKAKSTFQPFPGGPSAPTAPRTARKGLKVHFAPWVVDSPGKGRVKQ